MREDAFSGGIVLDASVAMVWCYPDEHEDYAYAVLDRLENTVAVVPSSWRIEVANALLMGERRSRLSHADVKRFFELLNTLAIRIDSETALRAFGETLALGRAHKLTAYDAAYLELAMRENLALATLDDPLKRAAKASGARLFS